MKTCKDCIKFDVCAVKKKYYANKPFKNGNIDKEQLKYKNGVEKTCNHFKDKSHIVELPCKVGTELFLSDYNTYHHRLKEYKIIGNRVVMVIKCFEFQQTFYRYVDEHFGKTVFLTKEEAEAKLKELDNGR